MKKILLTVLLSISYLAFSQKEANVWYFGKNAGLDFTSGEPVSLSNGALKTDEGCSSISDTEGNLLFYSDGINVWNKNHKLIRYSDGTPANNLKGNPSSTQSGLIVPNPENENIYYIFTVGTDLVPSDGSLPENPGFNYYTVDISKGNGGEIIAGPIDLARGNSIRWSEKITAVQGEKCNEIWILSITGSTFYAYKIDKNGVSTNPVTSSVPIAITDKRGYLKVAPNGSKIAIADYNASTGADGVFDVGNSKIYILNFNAVNGKVSNGTNNLVVAGVDGAPYGLEFSPKSNNLFISTFDGTNNTVFQFDVTQADILSTKKRVHQKIGYRGALQLGPNGKIYATVPKSYDDGTSYLDVIENPNEKTENIVYKSNAIKLSGLSTQGLPPFIQSFFAPIDIIDKESKINLSNSVQNFCIGTTYKIEPDYEDSNAKFTWFKNGSEVSNDKTLVLTEKLGEGTYEIKIEPSGSCKKTYSGKIEVKFTKGPKVVSSETFSQCDFDNNPLDGFTLFNFTEKENTLKSKNPNCTVDFFETDDSNFNTPINKSSYTNQTKFRHKIQVKVTDTLSKCFSIGIINLEVKTSGLNQYSDEYAYEIDENATDPNAKFSKGSGAGIYDFSQKTAKIIATSRNILSNETHNFQYFKTFEDASKQENEITPPYTNHPLENEAEIIVKVSNKSTLSCERVGKFTILIEKLPTPEGDLSPRILCIKDPNNASNTSVLRLDSKTRVPNDKYQWFRNDSVIEGANKPVYKANRGGEYKVEVYRKQQLFGYNCKGYATYLVKESNAPKIVNITTAENKDNPRKGTISISVEGLGDYEYALDSSFLSDFSKGEESLRFTFNDVEPGLHTVYIRDRNDCGMIASEKISIIVFQNHFTPNNDGIVDRWNILGINSQFYDVISIQIFDRHGKLLKQLSEKDGYSWDGNYNGKPMPSNDYWFHAELKDKKGNIIEKQGHFSLLRK